MIGREPLKKKIKQLKKKIKNSYVMDLGKAVLQMQEGSSLENDGNSLWIYDTNHGRGSGPDPLGAILNHTVSDDGP